MKKICIVLLSVILLLQSTFSLAFALECASAESLISLTTGDYVSLPELREQVKDGWHETYTAMGREVVANVDLRFFPKTDLCPVVRVRALGKEDVPPDALVPYQVDGASYNLNDCGVRFDYHLKSNLTADYVPQGYTVWKKPKAIYYNGEIPAERPENVDLDYDGLLAKIDASIKPIFGFTLDDFHIDWVQVSHLQYKTKDGTIDGPPAEKPYTHSGSYYLEAKQLFYGIPVIGSSGVYEKVARGELSFGYSNEKRYSLVLACTAELGVHTADIPLLSFDTMKHVLETQIQSGHLRGVDEMEFGYMAFYEGEVSDNRWLLIPVWRILGGYTQDKNKENVMPYQTKDGLTVPMAYDDYYYHAQTGEMLPTNAVIRNYLNVKPISANGQIITWDDVK